MDSSELFAVLRQLYQDRHNAVQAEWNRSLPLGDLVVDRWARAAALGFGDGSSVYDSSLIIGEVAVGKRTWIGPFTVLDGSGGLRIGDTCSISAGVHIYTHDSVKWALSGGRAEYDHAPVSIGSNTYVGPMTIITKGVTVGQHCLIGANSIVNKSIPDYCIAVGSTCRIVGRVEVAGDGIVSLIYDGD